jgi:hypothetical protein
MAILGPSRINLVIGIAAVGLVIASNAYSKSTAKVPLGEFKANHTPSKAWVFYFSFVLVFLVTLVHSQYSLHSTVETARQQLSGLRLTENQKIIPMPNVTTIGWRSSQELNIFFDQYFPFSTESASEYATRWIQICGHRTAAECQPYLIESVLAGTETLNDFVLVVRKTDLPRLDTVCIVGQNYELVSLRPCQKE